MQCGITTETGEAEGMKCLEYQEKTCRNALARLPCEKTLTRQHLHPGTSNDGLRLGGLSVFTLPFWVAWPT